ncbi:hypothetical protein TYRP_004145 [Tyrophagus putrescentiae]|nr:hypothetical protein TYRP_004145 [Tyrophagus putrescentiae]
MSTSYSYGFGAPGATNLYTYGSAAAAAAGTGGGNSPLMLASGSSTQSVMTTVPMSGHQESKMLAASDPMSMSSGTPPPNGDKNSKSPLGIVFGRPMSSYDGNYYVPVFYPLAWLGLNSGTNSAATSADPMAAFSSTASTSSLPAPSYAPFHHHHHHLQPRPSCPFTLSPPPPSPPPSPPALPTLLLSITLTVPHFYRGDFNCFKAVIL